VLVPGDRLEEATATMLELFPEGFVEERLGDSVELAAFTDAAGADRLAELFGRVATEPVSQGWEDEWKRFHSGVEVGPLWIGPPWERPAVGRDPVVIDPGRAFGTGAHPTTRLCIELLLELARGSVLDIGCGSGVLAIAACRLGFEPVVAVDSDPAAVEAAMRNAAANGVELEARLLDATAGGLPAADVALANIDLATLVRLSPASRSIVTSGYYEIDRPDLAGFVHAARRTEAGWAADVFRRQ
jgi:ribosomal protein L11 methyltransferase